MAKDTLAPEMSYWLDRVIRTCDVFERGPIMEAALTIGRLGTFDDPIKSVYDERIDDELRNFLLHRAERLP